MDNSLPAFHPSERKEAGSYAHHSNISDFVQFKILNQLFDCYKIWLESYAIRCHSDATFLNFLTLEVRTWRTLKPVHQKRHLLRKVID
jgi:hypothetical protein